jgi:alpha-tubulin suppressor-like RCC1 family protein
VEVHDLSGVVAIAGAGDGAYAVEGNGTVWAWGTTSTGALGNGEAAVAAAVRVRVHGLSGAAAVAGGGWGGYALLRDGSVRAWGGDVDGELGDGARASLSPVPVRVHGLSDVVSIAASESDGYAVLKDGSVWAWGANDRGQLGEGTEGAGTDVPVQVHGLSDVVAVAAYPGSDSIIALRKDGSVWHWGAVANYESIASNDIPERVPGLSGVVAVTAGYYTEFAVLHNGTVWGWGDDEDGEMGNNPKYRASFAPNPVQIQGLRGVIAVSGGTADELAIVAP